MTTHDPRLGGGRLPPSSARALPPRSIWMDAIEPAADVPATLPARTEVAVIGAGLAGLLTAWRLAAEGLSVVVIDAVGVAQQTTGHTTAKITALHGAIYSELVGRHGVEVASGYASANSRAVESIAALVDALGIDCDLARASAITCAETAAGAETIRREAAAARQAGLRVVERDDLGLPFPTTAAIELRDQAYFHPVKFCVALAGRLRDAGIVIAAPVRVHAVEERRRRCNVQTEIGELRAAAVVLTTHLPITDPAFLAARVRPERSYALAGVPATSLPRHLFLSVDTGWSLRPTVAHDGSFIVGGEGHSMMDHVDTARHYAQLDNDARRRFGIAEPTHRWSAFDYTATDHVPYIGRLSPGSRRRFVATGFAKWGMSNGMVAADIITDLVVGRPNEFVEMFDATRLHRSTMSREFARNNAHVAARFVRDRVRRGRTPDLRAGQGTVVRDGRRLLAVARDMDGRLHTVSAVCTHLGCVVAFNDAEQAWDCPCHGSRFALDGTVVNGPATSPLAEHDDDGAETSHTGHVRGQIPFEADRPHDVAGGGPRGDGAAIVGTTPEVPVASPPVQHGTHEHVVDDGA